MAIDYLIICIYFFKKNFIFISLKIYLITAEKPRLMQFRHMTSYDAQKFIIRFRCSWLLTRNEALSPHPSFSFKTVVGIGSILFSPAMKNKGRDLNLLVGLFI